MSQMYDSIDNAKVGINSVRNNCSAHVEDQTVEGFEVLKNPKYEVYLDAGGTGMEQISADRLQAFREIMER